MAYILSGVAWSPSMNSAPLAPISYPEVGGSPIPPTPVPSLFTSMPTFEQILEQERRKAEAKALAEAIANQEKELKTKKAKEAVMNLTEEEKETLKQQYGTSQYFRLCGYGIPSGLTEEEKYFTVLLHIQEHVRVQKEMESRGRGRMHGPSLMERVKNLEAELAAMKELVGGF
jgi:hypothetical protein